MVHCRSTYRAANCQYLINIIYLKEICAQLEELKSITTLNNEGWDISATWAAKWPSIGWNKLIKALDIYVKNYQPWSAEQCRTHWCQQVGGAQLILPVHVINEYSHPSRPLHPCPTWGDSEESLPRTGVSDWREADNGKYILGQGFAWCRANWGAREWMDGYGNTYTEYAEYDRAAVSELLRARVEQARRLLLEHKLETKPTSHLCLTM